MLHFDELLVRQAHKKELEKIKKLLTNDCTADILKKLSRLTTNLHHGNIIELTAMSGKQKTHNKTCVNEH